MEDFVHLHVHTQYSILDGQAAVPKLVDKAIKNGMKGMAITDHGNMFGIKEFFNYCNKVNEGKPEEEQFKPIFGCEVYCARRSLRLKENNGIDKSGWHLILLAKNEVGYHNLIKIVSEAWVDGYYHRPRTDHESLKRHHEGIIASSACLAGEIPRYISKGQIDEAEKALLWYKDVFGEDFYIELMRHEVKNPNQRANRETFLAQKAVEPTLISLARKHGVKIICTNDSHFVDEDNAEAHDRLLCLSTGRDLDDPKRMLYSKQEWFKTREEMNEVFADMPEALANTMEILGKVERYSIDHAPIMPFFAIPEEFGTEEEWRKRFTDEDIFNEFTRDENGNVIMSQADAEKKIKKLGGIDKLYRIKFEADYLKKITYDGARELYGDPVPDNVRTLLDFELHIMKTMGFPGYFLIVQDFINSARKELGVWVGPGRGSAAGSAVAYCLGITKIDPIKYDLLFERFLNPDRISLPDIDTDFDDDGRGKVLQWVTDKYGAEKVAHIITYGTMATKLAIKDVARVQKVPLNVVNALCKAIPDKLPNGKKMNLPNAIECIPELKDAATSPDPLLRDTMRFAQMLENNVRNTGVHACGTIICRDPIDDWVPVSTAEDKETGEKMRCTQYDGHYIEETGLIKMDFLGLKTLSQLKEAVANIKESLGIDVDIDKISIEDRATYQLYCDGRTIGTFQFESAGMQKYLRELQPTVFEDLIAMNALYRPGPMDYIPSFIARKNGREEIKYDIPCMEKYLKDTYGITVYQEQVMLLSRQLADFTRGESDALRKAMGKKKKAIVDAMKPKFIEGGKKNGHDPEVLEKIWGDWEKFASYAFNKSHATCYSWVAYQTAYLKAHYPAEYMAAVMSRNLDNITEITKLMDECRAMGIPTLGPDVNESWQKFSANHHGEIRFGISAIKGVGGAAADMIIAEREKNGTYKNVFDFIQRVNLSACNRKCVESLVLSGAFDGFGSMKREDFFAKNTKGETFIDTLVRYGQLYQNEMAQARNSLFGGDNAVEIATPPIIKGEQWSDIERLNRERDLVGIYLSAHPLDEYRIVLDNLCNTKCAELNDVASLNDREDIIIGGIVTGTQSKYTKSGKPCGFVTIEDYEGSGQLAFFGEDWGRWNGMLIEGSSVYITAKCVPRYRDSNLFDLKVQNIEYLQTVKERAIDRFTINITTDDLDSRVVEELNQLICLHPGRTKLFFQLHDRKGGNHVLLRSRTHEIDVRQDLINFIENYDFLDYNIN